jgi:hypothetical protein
LAIVGGASYCGFAAPPESVPPVHTAATIDKNITTCYRSFWPELEMTAKFGSLGINTRCFFAANAINSAGFEYCKYPLIWQGVKKYDFAAYDRQVDDLLAANPRAKFLCMIDLNTPYWLTRKLAYDSFDVISHAAADPQWIKITTEWMLDFIEYSEKKYGDKIEAYILSGGGTSEWYEYDRGKSSRVKNAAWRAWCKKNGYGLGEDVPAESALKKAAHENVIYDPATEMDKIQYWRFHNEVIAEAVLHFASAARPKIGKGKELGVFFGYYMVSDSKLVSFGHLDYERVMASPDFDFFISPGTYNDRMIGGGSGPQLVQGTALRYGKRYLHEIDHRTHCVGPSPGSENKWKNQAEDDAGHKREAAFALIHHTSLWWFDMWGGWYQKEETRQLIGVLQKISDAYVNDRSPSVAEMLLVADPQSAYYVNEKMPHASAMARQFREKVSRTGAPYDVYSFNDLAVIDLSRYKVVFLPATLLITPERAEVLNKHVLNSNRAVVWVYAPGICDGRSLDAARVRYWTGSEYGTVGPVSVDRGGWTSVYAFEYKTLTPSVLREILRRAGVHLYVDGEDPVYANQRLLAIHTKEGGEKKIALMQVCKKVVDVFTGTTVAENVKEFSYRFETPDTALFELVR